MFLAPLTLQKISQLRDPSERVPLGERGLYETALELIENDAFLGFELASSPSESLRLKILWRGAGRDRVVVQISEEGLRGALDFSCSAESGTCAHQWASYVVLWQSATVETDQIEHPELAKLSGEMKKRLMVGESAESHGRLAKYVDTTLDSISLFLDEPPLLGGPSLERLLGLDFGKYRAHAVSKEEEHLSPRLWNLPEVFRKKMTALSESSLNEVNQQIRIADIVRYNFSNGMQISAKEILRHPLHRKVSGDLLPQEKAQVPAFARWPLVQRRSNAFVGQALAELEEITQGLLARIAELHRQKKINVFLQSRSTTGRALKLESIEFDPAREVDWRVDFIEKKELQAEFKLVCHRNKALSFFESFAVEAEDGVLIVHPWLREISQLQDTLANLSPTYVLGERKMPGLTVIGEFPAKAILRALRSRTLPVQITGGSRTLETHQSLTEVHLSDTGSFFLRHEARVPGQANLARRGWSTKSILYLQALSQGISSLLRSEIKDVASRSLTKRDWDLRLLKHLGILQYVMFETLSYQFDGTLTDGSTPAKDQVFTALHEKIRALLSAGQSGVFVRDTPLTELCSSSVLRCFEDFVGLIFKTVSGGEAFYSENGEVVLEGVVEREFRLIYELLKKMALTSSGEAFKRSRTPFLSKISSVDFEKDPEMSNATFHFPTGDSQIPSTLHGSLESLQPLIPHGFKLFYNDQPLQELEEDEFHVDFLLKGERDQRLFNWFELNPKFFLRGEEVDPDQFLKLGGGGVIEYSGKLFLVPRTQMPSLRRLEIFWEKLQGGKVESGGKKNGQKIYQLPRSQTLELLALRASGIKIQGDAEWTRLCDFYDHLGSKTRDLKLPASMKAELKPYQALGVQWLQDLYSLRLGALLADDMGLGKTLQTLCFMDDLRAKGELGHALIVVPSSLIFNWQNEVEKFTPDLPLVVFSNRDRDAIGRRLGRNEDLVVIVTYGLLMEHEDVLSQVKWKVLVFDEAQNLKNITTKRTSAARSLNAQFKIGLTGTPMENHYGEFYSLIDLLVPGSLGKLDTFRRQFVNTETVEREHLEDLKLKIKPLLLRRTKKEILDQLPDKQETKVSIAFEERQKEIYRDIALSYNQRVQETMAAQGQASVQLQMLTALLRLRQACSDPTALPNVKYTKVPPKIETLRDSLSEIVESGESALVFTQFLQTLEHAAEILRKDGLPVFVLHGGVPTKQRQKVLSEFNSIPKGAVLLMTLKTGGVGLNLTKASYVFHLEPWWNPSVENQATDRAHRIGQNKAVQVFRYIMHESLEEKIELLKDRKDRKFQVLFSETEKDPEVGSGSAALSKEDFDFLLGLK